MYYSLGACNQLYAPVRGADGHIYPNKCYADAAGVRVAKFPCESQKDPDFLQPWGQNNTPYILFSPYERRWRVGSPWVVYNMRNYKPHSKTLIPYMAGTETETINDKLDKISRAQTVAALLSCAAILAKLATKI